MTTVNNVSSNQIFTINKIKNNQFQTSEIGNIFPAKAKTETEILPKPEAEIKTKADVAKATGLDVSFINSLTEFEGLKLNQYKDSGGVRTIGYGHNIDHDPNYKYGKTITKEQAYKLLADDLIKAQKDMKECIGHAELTKGQNEALTDMFFNVGIEKLQDTNFIKCIKEKRFDDAVCEFNFIKIGQEVSPALCRRRIDDIERFCSDTPNARTVEIIEFITTRGNNYFNEKLKTSNASKKAEYAQQQKVFNNLTTPVLAKTQRMVKDRESKGLRGLDEIQEMEIKADKKPAPIEKLIPNPLPNKLIFKINP